MGAMGVATAITASGYGSIPGANDRLRMAVIGAGGMATSHMESLVKARDIDNFEIVNVCDIYTKRWTRPRSLQARDRLGITAAFWITRILTGC